MTIWFGESIECSWIFHYTASSWARTSLLNWKFKCQTEWEEMIRKKRGKITRESEESVWDEEKRSRINYNKRHSFARRDTYQWNRKKLYMKSLEFADADRSNFPPFHFDDSRCRRFLAIESFFNLFHVIYYHLNLFFPSLVSFLWIQPVGPSYVPARENISRVRARKKNASLLRRK